jgi:hypothetical protein
MRSRYDLADDASQKASDDTFYPDIFTIPIKKFRYNNSAKEHKISQVDQNRPDMMMYREYGVPEFDDVVLWINNIGMLNEEAIGNKIYIPAKSDMERFYFNHRT